MLEGGKDILNRGQLTDSLEKLFKPNWQNHNKTEGLYFIIQKYTSAFVVGNSDIIVHCSIHVPSISSLGMLLVSCGFHHFQDLPGNAHLAERVSLATMHVSVALHPLSPDMLPKKFTPTKLRLVKNMVKSCKILSSIIYMYILVTKTKLDIIS